MGERRHRHVFHNQRAAACDKLRQRAGLQVAVRQEAAVFNAACAAFSRHVPCPLQHEQRVPVIVEPVASAEPLVDQQWLVERPGAADGGVQGGIVMSAHRVMHPVQDVASLGTRCAAR